MPPISNCLEGVLEGVWKVGGNQYFLDLSKLFSKLCLWLRGVHCAYKMRRLALQSVPLLATNIKARAAQVPRRSVSSRLEAKTEDLLLRESWAPSGRPPFLRYTLTARGNDFLAVKMSP